MCLRQSLGSLDSRGCHHFPWEPNKSYATKISCWHKDLFFLFSQTQGRRLLSRDVERKKPTKSKFALKFKQSIMPWEETQLTGGYKYNATGHLEEPICIRQGWPGMDALLGGSQPHCSHLVLHQVLRWRQGVHASFHGFLLFSFLYRSTKTFSIPLPVPRGSAWIKSLHLLH